MSTAEALIEDAGATAGGGARVGAAALEVYTTSTTEVPTLELTFTPGGVVGAEDGSGHPIAETRAGTALPLSLDL